MLWWTIRQLKAQDRNIRVRAVRKIAASDTGDAVRTLAVALLDPASYPDVRQAIPEEMTRFGPMAVEPLLAALTDDDFRVRRNAVEALREIGDLRAVMPLTKVLTDHMGIVRKAAIDALARFKDARAVDPWLSYLRTSCFTFVMQLPKH